MPAAVTPVVLAICAVFSLFIIVVGGVAVWSSLPERERQE